MKRLTGFVVITLLVFGCSAALVQAEPSGPVNFGLLDASLAFQYCDYFDFSYGTGLAAGIDNQSACDAPDGTMIGVSTTVPGGLGLPVSGTVVTMGDSGGDAYFGGFEGYLPLMITKTNASLSHYGFQVLIVEYDSFDVYLTAYGYLIKQLPPGSTPLVGKRGVKPLAGITLSKTPVAAVRAQK